MSRKTIVAGLQEDGRLMKPVKEILEQHPFTRDLDPRHKRTLSGCARECHFPTAGYLWRQGEEATVCYLIRSGEVTIGIHIPYEGFLQIDTVGEGGIVGWSWFLSPHRWHFDARALTAIRALALDTRCLRRLCDQDPHLRCELLSRIAPIIVRRLEASQEKLTELQQVHRPPIDCLRGEG